MTSHRVNTSLPDVEELKRFIRTLGNDLLRKIEDCGDPISFVLNGRRNILVEIIPERQESDRWSATVKFYQKSLWPLSAPKPLDTIRLNLGEVPSNNDDVKMTVVRALESLPLSTSHNMAKTKEPVTFSYTDGGYKQLEARIFYHGAGAHYDIHID